MKILELVVVVDGKRSVKPQKKVLLCINIHDNILKPFYLFIAGS